jgi:hypothetical protein
MTPEEIERQRQQLAAAGLASPDDGFKQALGGAIIGGAQRVGGAIEHAAAPLANAAAERFGGSIGVAQPPPDLPPAGPPLPPPAAPVVPGAGPEPMMQVPASPAPRQIHPMSDEAARKQAEHAMGLDAVTDATKSRIQGAEQGVREGMRASSEATQQGYEQAQGILEGVASHHATERFKRQAAQIVHDDELAKQQAEIDTARSELPKFDEDPERYWKNQTTGNRIQHGIAYILGGLGEAFAGIKNPVATMRQAAQEDIESQRAFYDRKTTHGLNKVKGLETVYGQLREKGFDDQKASLLAENHYLDGIQAQLGAAQAKTQNEQERLASRRRSSSSSCSARRTTRPSSR